MMVPRPASLAAPVLALFVDLLMTVAAIGSQAIDDAFGSDDD